MKVPYIIYQFWTGDNQISKNRLNAFNYSKEHFNIPVKLLYKDDIQKMILPEYPLHPIYNYLSHNHKSDYLRSYFMNFYGGGYSDIKYFSTNNNWKQCFDYINNHQQIDIIGVKDIIKNLIQYEIQCNNTNKYKRHIYDPTYYNSIDTLKLLSNGWFIVRPHSKFSEQWYKRVNKHCDQVFNIVKEHPATINDTDPYSTIYTQYPLRWSQLQCEIFHQLCYDFYDNGCINNMLINGYLQNFYR